MVIHEFIITLHHFVRDHSPQMALRSGERVLQNDRVPPKPDGGHGRSVDPARSSPSVVRPSTVSIVHFRPPLPLPPNHFRVEILTFLTRTSHPVITA